MDVKLRNNNLYRNGQIIEFDNGEAILVRELIAHEPTVHDQFYTVRQLDRLDILAYRFYKGQVEDASKFWWVIADANGIPNPLDISEYVGEQIIIPNILNVLLSID